MDHSWGWDRWWAGGSEPQSCWWGLWDWLQGAECGGGKGSEMWGSPQKGTPTLGETRKGDSHPLASLRIPTAPFPTRQGCVTAGQGPFPPTTHSFKPQGHPGPGEASGRGFQAAVPGDPAPPGREAQGLVFSGTLSSHSCCSGRQRGSMLTSRGSHPPHVA